SMRRHKIFARDWSSDVCSSDLKRLPFQERKPLRLPASRFIHSPPPGSLSPLRLPRRTLVPAPHRCRGTPRLRAPPTPHTPAAGRDRKSGGEGTRGGFGGRGLGE